MDEFIDSNEEELEDEITGLRWMIQYSIDAPDEEARLKILQDALNGVRGAENVEKIDGEIDRLRKALEWIDIELLRSDVQKERVCRHLIRRIRIKIAETLSKKWRATEALKARGL